jgi:predicted dehydrogenase
MNRRTFVSSALAAPLAAGAAEPRIRIAFLGASHSHASEKVKVVRENPSFELAGIWEEDASLREQYQKSGVRILSREQLLNDRSIQVIAVESGVKAHAGHARLALEAGKHIHLEKPPADNLSEFRALVALARQRRLLIEMGYMWRYHPGINAALEAARQGWLGEVYLVRGTMNTLIDADRRPEWALFHGGQMFEQGCHLIDPMVRLLGRPQKITPILRKHGAFNDHLADNTVAVFEYPRALGIVMSSVLQPGATQHRAFEIFGSNGNAVVRPIEPPILQIDLAKPAGPYEARTQTVKLPPFRRYVGDFAELAEAVRLKRPLSVTPEQDLLVHEALLGASEMLAASR